MHHLLICGKNSNHKDRGIKSHHGVVGLTTGRRVMESIDKHALLFLLKLHILGSSRQDHQHQRSLRRQSHDCTNLFLFGLIPTALGINTKKIFSK